MASTEHRFANTLLQDIGRWRIGQIDLETLLIELKLCSSVCQVAPEWAREFRAACSSIAELQAQADASRIFPSAETIERQLQAVETLLQRVGRFERL